MSFEAVRWALSQSQIRDPQEKLLLVVLADFLNKEARQCNPSRQTLMKAACIQNSNTLTARLNRLVQKGLISIERGNGSSNNYHLHELSTFTHEAPTSFTHEAPTSFTHEAPTTFTHEAPPASHVKHEPGIEPLINSTLEREQKKTIPCPFSPGSKIPDDYKTIAEEKGVLDPQEEFEKFIEWYRSRDKHLADWMMVWRSWVRRYVEYRKNSQQRDAQRQQQQRANSFTFEPPGGFTEAYYKDDIE